MTALKKKTNKTKKTNYVSKDVFKLAGTVLFNVSVTNRMAAMVTNEKCTSEQPKSTQTIMNASKQSCLLFFS